MKKIKSLLLIFMLMATAASISNVASAGTVTCPQSVICTSGPNNLISCDTSNFDTNWQQIYPSSVTYAGTYNLVGAGLSTANLNQASTGYCGYLAVDQKTNNMYWLALQSQQNVAVDSSTSANWKVMKPCLIIGNIRFAQCLACPYPPRPQPIPAQNCPMVSSN